MATEKKVIKKEESGPQLVVPPSAETSHRFGQGDEVIWPDERKEEVVRPKNAPMPKMPLAEEKQAQTEKQNGVQEDAKPAEPEFKVPEQEAKPVSPTKEKKEDLSWNDEVDRTVPGAEGDRPYNMHLFKRRSEEDK